MSTISASTTSTTGFKVTSDTTGTLVFQTGASPTTAMTINSSQIISFTNPPTATGGGSVATNTAYGTSALAANTTGTFSTAVGYEAGKANTNGYSITAVGARAGWVVNGATNFTAVGTDSGRTSTTAASASFFGANSGFSNTTGSYLVAVGDGALYSNTTASNNTAVGYQAGYTNTTGSECTNIGQGAGYTNSVGRRNTFIGRQAGYTSNATTAGQGYNTCVGYSAGYSLTTGYGNTFIGCQDDTQGYGSGHLVTTGNKNTILGGYNGNQGGLDIRTASNYIVLSDGDGNPRFFTNGPQAWAINSASGYRYSELDFNIANINKASFYWDDTLARFYVTTSSAAMYIANGGTSWTSASDERAKDIIEPIDNAVNKVSTLRTVIGKYKTDADGTRRSFLIAQDVLAVLPEAVAVPDEGATEKDGSPAMMGVEYTAVIPLLVAAIKELKAEIDTLKGQA